MLAQYFPSVPLFLVAHEQTFNAHKHVCECCCWFVSVVVVVVLVVAVVVVVVVAVVVDVNPVEVI